jgi:hypothetical protein
MLTAFTLESAPDYSGRQWTFLLSYELRLSNQIGGAAARDLLFENR